MGIQDRDWYREALRKKLDRDYFKEKPQSQQIKSPWFAANQNTYKPKKTSIWNLIFKVGLVFGSIIFMIETISKLKV